ncbi:hypothetical protein LTR53_014674 [Teratosphaeriaceae sp. CCFEE 6253]|nr:hypothetical protein LTR53_014674 [Teratosphaeriaceae sp. CCFEE 6253]
MAARTDARFSTYSGAPSLQPSLAPTLDTQATSTSTRSATTPRTHPQSQQHHHPSSHDPNHDTMNEKLSRARSAASTLSSTPSTDPNPAKSADLRHWAGTLGRLQDARLEKQRYVMTDKKSDEVSQLALGAKVERALARRMTGQDATFRAKKTTGAAGGLEKRGWEVEAN